MTGKGTCTNCGRLETLLESDGGLCARCADMRDHQQARAYRNAKPYYAIHIHARNGRPVNRLMTSGVEGADVALYAADNLQSALCEVERMRDDGFDCDLVECALVVKEGAGKDA